MVVTSLWPSLSEHTSQYRRVDEAVLLFQAGQHYVHHMLEDCCCCAKSNRSDFQLWQAIAWRRQSSHCPVHRLWSVSSHSLCPSTNSSERGADGEEYRRKWVLRNSFSTSDTVRWALAFALRRCEPSMAAHAQFVLEGPSYRMGRAKNGSLKLSNVGDRKTSLFVTLLSWP